MSATGRTDIREPEDFYRTPAWVTRAILPHLGINEGSVVLDPCCGDGAILDVIESAHPKALRFGIELDGDRAARARARHTVEQRDALDVAPWAFRFQQSFPNAAYPTVVVTNPPFKTAMGFVTRARSEVAPRLGLVAMLLRLNWLASKERRGFHCASPGDIHVLSRRPEFAASLSCLGAAGKTRKTGCGWALLQTIDAPRPKTCPLCDVGKVGVTTTDSCEYAWWIWAPKRGGRWFLLDEVPARLEVKEALAAASTDPAGDRQVSLFGAAE